MKATGIVRRIDHFGGVAVDKKDNKKHLLKRCFLFYERVFLASS